MNLPSALLPSRVFLGVLRACSLAFLGMGMNKLA